jgi:ATP-binding cassette subfamily B protein
MSANSTERKSSSNSHDGNPRGHADGHSGHTGSSAGHPSSSNIEIFRWGLAMGWSLNRIAFIVWSLVTFSGALLPAFIIANIGRIVDQIASGISAGRDFGDIRNLILILGSLWVLQNLYSVAGQFSHRQLLNHFAPKMHKRLIEALDGVPVRRFDDPHFNDLTSKARGASESVTYFTMYVINFASQVFGTAGIFFVAARIRWYFPIVALLIMAVRFVVDQSAGRQVMDTWNEIVPLERRKKHFFYVNSKRNPAKDIRMLQLTDWFAALRSRYAKELRDKMHRIHVLRNRGQYLSVALDVVFSALAIVPSLIMVYARQMTIGELTMTWQISERLSGQMNSLATNFFGVYQHLADLKILKELLELCMSDERLPMIKALGHESVSNDPEPKSDNVFELDNVSFVYHGEHEALHGITLSIPRGQVVALCGENGAGKSTLVKIMLGLYSPTSGEIRFEGHPYGELERDYLLRKIGVAFQEPDRYNYTIRECIGFGNLAKLDDLAAVKEAARKGGAAEFIRDVAHDNYEANLGRMLYRDGLELSGGQWQRLGVSRAHIGDRDVLVMDEPASQLDPIAEYEQFKAVREMVHGRTAILISHRIGFARLADRIVVLKNGRIVEDGTHEALMRRKGEYAALFTSQAKWYADSEADGDTPGDQMPGAWAPAGDGLGGDVPGRDIHGSAVPDGDASDSTMPDGDAPGYAMPGGDVSDSTMPDGDAPGCDTPGGDVPGSTTPDGDAPGYAMLDGETLCQEAK